MKPTKAQKRAILHGKGPMMVLAGPGSGKTLVITQRTKALIEEYGVNPREILVITFTKAAAQEMKERFMKLMGLRETGVNFGTFHAVFFTILKYAYNYNGSNIIREEDKLRWFTEVIRKMNLEIEDEKEFVAGICSEISLVKTERMDLKHYYSINTSEESFQSIYKQYDEYLKQRNLIDFDDMLLLCYELLTQRPDILKFWQSKFKYILIDEFQDINQIQYDIVRLLAKPENNLFIVGDDDQSIYRFRGAKPEIMLHFPKDYKDCKEVLLDVNYRSTPNILEGALRVVKHNKERYEKEFVTYHSKGEDIKIETFVSLSEENKKIIGDIMEYKRKGIPFSEMAVLFRTNTGPRALIDGLMEYNIPFKMKDSIPNIYEHWIAKNIIAYIKLAMGSLDRGLFLQIMNRPKRYLTRDCLDNPEFHINDLKVHYSDKRWVLDRIEKLEYDLLMLKKMNPYAAIHYIRNAIGYDEYLKEYAEYRRIKVDELYDTIEELQESSKEFRTYEDWFYHMEEYKEELKKQITNQNNRNEDRVNLSTMHSAKGLEYEVVFIIDVNEGIIPHRKANLPEDLEEERRMFYVAMTRAKKHLHIYSVKERYNKDFTRSRFVGEMLIDQDLLKKGVRVEHKSYGAGTIKGNKDGKLTIYFDRIKKERVLDLDFCIQNELIKII